MSPTPRAETRRSPAFGIDVPDGVEVAVPIWTTTPWTLPASLAISLGPELTTCWSKARPRATVRVAGWCWPRRWRKKALKRYGVDEVVIHGRAAGAALEGMHVRPPVLRRTRHPDPARRPRQRRGRYRRRAYRARPRPGGLRGLAEIRAGREIFGGAAEPVDGRGVYLPSTPPADGVELAGMHVWKANDALVEVLRANAALLAFSKLTHSYPHCWRQ